MQVNKIATGVRRFVNTRRETLAGGLVGLGKECLIGAALSNQHRLEIDFEHRIVQLLQGKS